MRHLTPTILILFCFLFSINAQENYSPGYIITNTYDTIRGYIDYKTDIQNAKVCHFKTNLNDEEKSFLPGQIAGYRFTDAGRFYVTKSVKIKDSARTVFLEYLVKGIMNLYYYTEGSDASTDVNYNKYYFFENEKGEMNSITKGPDKIIEIDNGGLKIERITNTRECFVIFFEIANQLEMKRSSQNLSKNRWWSLQKTITKWSVHLVRNALNLLQNRTHIITNSITPFM